MTEEINPVEEAKIYLQDNVLPDETVGHIEALMGYIGFLEDQIMPRIKEVQNKQKES